MDKKLGVMVAFLLIIFAIGVSAAIGDCNEACLSDGTCNEGQGTCVSSKCNCDSVEDEKDTSSSEDAGDIFVDDPFRVIFDTGDLKFGKTQSALDAAQKIALEEGGYAVDVPKVDGVEVRYPQGIVENKVEENWKFESWFDAITGQNCPPTGCLRMSGQMDCDNNGRCVIGWFDYYSGAGCELNVLAAELQFDTKEKKATVLNECEWYYDKGDKEAAAIEKLEKTVSKASLDVYPRDAKGKPVEGNVQYCEDYRIDVKNCWGELTTDEVWPYSNTVKGTIHLTYTSSVDVLDNKLSPTKNIDVETEKDEKISFNGERRNKVPPPEKGIPGLYVGIGAALIAAGIAWGALSLHQKRLVAQMVAAKAAAGSASSV